MDRDNLKTFGDTEHLFSGNLTLGEQKKEGTHISFKDKSRRFFVLRCLRQKFLTLSGYRNIKEYKTAQAGNPHKSVEQIVVTQKAKVHAMHLPAKKQKQSHVLCIIEEKKTVYLEVDTSEELKAWSCVFDDVFIRLGWKQPPSSPLPSPPPSASDAPPSPGANQPDSFTEYPSKGRRKHNSVSGSGKGNVFDLFQPGRDASMRHSSASLHMEEAEATGSHFNFDRPKSNEMRRTVEPMAETRDHDQNTTPVHPRVPLHDQYPWIENTLASQERLVNIHEYVNLKVDKNHCAPLVHPGPPALPPRSRAHHRRFQTCPEVCVSSLLGSGGDDDSPPSPPPQSGGRNSGDFDGGDGGLARAGSEPTPKISVTEPPGSPSLHAHPRLRHLLDDAETGPRKVSLPQPLEATRQRRLGVVAPPAHQMLESPPDSPAQMRKAGSYANLALDLTSRPLPSPTDGDSFDVQTLRWEMGHMDGFAIALDKRELQDALGLVRIADYVWVAGWRAGKPEIPKKLHVGDQLRQINEQIVVDPSVTNTLFETSAVDEIMLVIRRLPYAKVRYLHRSSPNEGWGLEVEGNRILNVSKSGPAANAKLTTRAQGAFSERLCDWIITELDGEPVCLLSKKDQVKIRMDNAGLDMALVIQPDDFIKRLNAELQKIRFAHEYFLGSHCRQDTHHEPTV